MKIGRIAGTLCAVICVGVLAAVNVSAETYEPVATATWNGHNYALYDVSMTWHEAKAYCESIGGYLVTITSKNEQLAIETLLNSGAKYQYWLGATDEQKEGTWKWVTGEAWSYTNFHKNGNGDDYRGIEEYLQIYRTPRSADALYKWNDAPFDNILYDEREYFSTQYIGFICEFN